MNENLEQQIAEDQKEISEAQAREQAVIKAAAQKQSKRYIAKHKKEIERLKRHAEECLHVCNKDGYIYAIEKLRLITLQKRVDRDVLESLWISSKQRYDELVMEAYQKVNETTQVVAGDVSDSVSTTPVCSM